MYLPLAVHVESIGEDVRLSIGTWTRSMFFETAILLASWLDECAREAKEWAGNEQRRLRGIGTLHDASAKDWINAGQPNDPRHVFRVNRDLLKKAQIAVRSEGAMVVFTAGTSMASMPYAAAIEISQWIRLRAKESQMRAGDVTRHWSKVKQAHVEQVGPGVTRG